VLANVLIKYKRIRDGRGDVACVRLTNSGTSFVFEKRKGTEKTLEDQRKWEIIHQYDDYFPSPVNDRLYKYRWIVVDGKYAGRFCKGLFSPKASEDTLDPTIYDKVALAHLEDRDGFTVTVTDEPPQEVRIRQQDLAVVHLNPVELEKELAGGKTWDGAKLTRYKEAKKRVGQELDEIVT
jgi:hypothetical protein